MFAKTRSKVEGIERVEGYEQTHTCSTGGSVPTSRGRGYNAFVRVPSNRPRLSVEQTSVKEQGSGRAHPQRAPYSFGQSGKPIKQVTIKNPRCKKAMTSLKPFGGA